MTVIELPDEQAAVLKEQAQARGLTIGQWILQLANHALPSLVPQEGREQDERPIWDVIADSLKNIPPEDRALLPKDGASQVDHYVYGLPKRDQ